MTQSLAIVIPAHNEGARLKSVLHAIPQRLSGIERILTIVVDDGSSDDTASVAAEPGVLVLRHVVNLGAGAALRTGSEAAIELGADIVVHMDADGQHSPEDLPRLIQPLLDGGVAATGVRRFRRPMPWLFIFGNRFLAVVTRIFFAVDNPDTQCAYRAFKAGAWPSLRWQSSDYAFASEMLVRAHRGGIQWTLVPIETVYHDRYKGTGIADGVRILRKLVSWRVVP